MRGIRRKREGGMELRIDAPGMIHFEIQPRWVFDGPVLLICR